MFKCVVNCSFKRLFTSFLFDSFPQLVVECEYVQDMLHGGPHDEIRIRRVEVLQDHFEDDDE